MRAFEPGDIINDRYEIERQIGAGGMGAVYLARHLKLEIPVGLKTCHLGLTVTAEDRPEYFKRFKREAKALAKLKHTNIVSVLDYDVIDDTPFLVMEYFKGLPALMWGEQTKPSCGQWLAVFRPLFQSLAVAHRAGVLHRDIKSPNVLVRGTADAPEVMLIDWGVALDQQLSALTQQDAVVGSPGSIDPARYFGASYTPQSDLYAMGSLMYAAMCGKAPIVPREGQNKHEANAENRVAPPHEINPAVTGDLEELLLALLETNPDNRPPSAQACVAIIDDIARGAEVDWESVYARYPKQPFVAAADAHDECAGNVAVDRQGTLKVTKPEGARAEPAEVDVPESHAGEVRIDSPRFVQKTVTPRAELERNLARLGVSSPRRRWPFVVAGVAASIVVVTVLVIGRASTGPTSAQPTPDSALAQMVTPEDLERASKAAPPALEQIIQAKTADASPAPDRLDKFDANIRARYPTSPDRPSGDRPSGKSDNNKDHQPPNEKTKLDLGIVSPSARTPDSNDDRAAQLHIPHGAKSSVFLLDLLDTSSGEPVRAELRSSLRVGNDVVIPVGSILIGRAALREVRATASFNRVIFRDGREFPIRAEAILRDGREGISGGQFEYGESKSSGDAARVVGEVASEAAVDVAGMVLPGADALSRTGKRAIARESTKARHEKDDEPRQRDRVLVKRGAEILVQFRLL